MKWLNFKKTFYLSIMLMLLPASLAAQENDEYRKTKYQTRWENLIPSHVKMQYAGGMGFLSLGTGWDYGKKNRWETDIFLGYVPKYSTDHPKITFTLKQNYIPWRRSIWQGVSFDPLACGLYANSMLDKDFWVQNPDKYPNGYYTFSTKVRFYIYVGQRVTYAFPNSNQAISFYYEISSNDLYIVSAMGNKHMKPSDYLRISFGLKLQLL